MFHYLSEPSSYLVRAALDKMHSLGLVPRSRYTTSWQGLTFKQAIHMPLPPYLSPIPVIFRMLAYAVITPVVLLLFLDVGGYIVWRIYEGVSLTGTRTAFYKFRTSPVFTRSRTGSPIINKKKKELPHKSEGHASTNTSTLSTPAQSPPRSPPGTRETSISPISSSASLHDETYRMDSDGDGELVTNNSSSNSSSPGFGGESALLDDDETDMNSSGNTSAFAAANNMDSSIRRRAVNRHSGSTIGNNTSSSTHRKRFSVGGSNGDGDGDGDDEDHYYNAEAERSSTPTLTSLTSGATHPHLTRSNSLGLGFNAPAPVASQPTMYIAPSSSSPSSSSTAHQHQHQHQHQQQNPPFSSHTSSADDLVKIERSSPASMASSSANFGEEDDKMFNEAKEKGNFS